MNWKKWWIELSVFFSFFLFSKKFKGKEKSYSHFKVEGKIAIELGLVEVDFLRWISIFRKIFHQLYRRIFALFYFVNVNLMFVVFFSWLLLMLLDFVENCWIFATFEAKTKDWRHKLAKWQRTSQCATHDLLLTASDAKWTDSRAIRKETTDAHRHHYPHHHRDHPHVSSLSYAVGEREDARVGRATAQHLQHIFNCCLSLHNKWVALMIIGEVLPLQSHLHLHPNAFPSLLSMELSTHLLTLSRSLCLFSFNSFRPFRYFSHESNRVWTSSFDNDV